MNYTIIANNEDRLEIDIKREGSFNIIVFTGFLTIGITGVLLVLIYEIIKAPYKLDEKMAITIGVCFLTALYVCKLFLWNLKGKEYIIIKDNQLIIRKKGTLLSVPRKYELTFIEKFSIAYTSPYPEWMKMYGIAGGKIEFNYLSEPRYFGQTLSQVQAQEIIELIQARIYTTPTQSLLT